jgi:hypothetical protein
MFARLSVTRGRLPLILSAAALTIALLDSAPVGHAAARALEQVVPRAKKADFATNAGKLNGHRSAVNAIPGQIPVVGGDGKLAASLAGPPGPQGPPGVSGYQMIERQMGVNNASALNLDCPNGKSVLAAGHYFRGRDDATNLVLAESRPISGSTWRFNILNNTGGTRQAYVYVICANASS